MNVLLYTSTTSHLTSQILARLKLFLRSHYDIILVDSNALRTEPWSSSTRLLIMPDGDCIAYRQSMRSTVIKKIQEYVAGGGNYVGIGAGAMYATKGTFEEEGISDENASEFGAEVGREEKGLAFLDGEFKLWENKSNKKEEEEQSRDGKIVLELNKEVLGKHYPNMPHEIIIDNNEETMSPTTPPNRGYFHLKDSRKVIVLARYKRTAHPAIIYSSIGQGTVILLGINILTPSYCDSMTSPSDTSSISHLLCSLFKLQSLNVSPTESHVPRLSPLFLTSFRSSLTERLLRNIKPITSDNGMLKMTNNTFRLVKDLAESGELLRRYDRGELDIMEDGEIPVLVYHDDPPGMETTKTFDIGAFFEWLRKERQKEELGRRREMEFGSSILFGDSITSTQTILDNNFSLTQHLPTGFVVTATTQIRGRGRGRNSWISPPGCLQFSLVLRHPLNIYLTSVVFVQYLLGLAVVEGIRDKEGYENIPLKLKWPNDIYAEVSTRDGTSKEYVKIGGILVNSHFVRDEFLLIAGCGVNTNNVAPTTAINQIIASYNALHNTELSGFTQEGLLAVILTKFEIFYLEFVNNKRGFGAFLDLYYKRWLHSDQIVTVESLNKRARIVGITTDFGFLKAVVVDENANDTHEIITLQPDGNSFDMMKGMITRKVN